MTPKGFSISFRKRIVFHLPPVSAGGFNIPLDVTFCRLGENRLLRQQGMMRSSHSLINSAFKRLLI